MRNDIFGAFSSPSYIEHISKDEKSDYLEIIGKVTYFEDLLNNKFNGAKRFSIEGHEGIIVALELIIQELTGHCIVAMAHRGRLSALTTVFKKPIQEILDEFMDNDDATDVKYHKGYETKRGDLKLTLLPNPSHLESIFPVCMGNLLGHFEKNPLTRAIIVHGDAAFAGQGVVYEAFQLSGSYKCSGIIHIIADNEIGFTATPKEYSSTKTCSDIAKAFDIPVFYITDISQIPSIIKIIVKFKTDVILHIKGQRKYGHNEGDDPTFTNHKKPFLKTYEKIPFENEKINLKHEVERELKIENPINLEHLQKQLSTVPFGFHIHSKLSSILHKRLAAIVNDEGIDFAASELLAFSYLLNNKIDIRLSGQDSIRGTFSSRHGIWTDQVNGAKYSPLSKFDGKFTLINSPVSEEAVLGFEYGYSVSRSNEISLTIWEAQYGDFANCAQVMIDQYISSGFSKWGQKSNLTMLLPHGYEGQGSEHSSARIERFLSLSANNNWQLVIPTSPSNYFHILKNQAFLKKPLVIFTPKSLIRSVKSYNKEFFEDFKPIIFDDKKSNTLIICYGKIYFDIKDVNASIVRVERLYPLPEIDLSSFKKVIYIQEEPSNMGGMAYILPRLKHSNIRVISRKESDFVATGSLKTHKKEQAVLIENLLKEI